VLVGLVAYRFQTYAGLSLALGAAGQALASYPFRADFTCASNAIVDEARNELLRVATHGYDYLIMLDDDVTFDAEMLGEVLSMTHAYGDCVVAGVRAPGSTTGKSVVQPDLGRKAGFSEVERVGGAAMFVSMARLHAVSWDPPFFRSQPLLDGTVYGEDYYFCDNVRRNGGKVYCHHSFAVGNGPVHFPHPGTFS
jgi:hypothetical protein